jgi:hypothetical protein
MNIQDIILPLGDLIVWTFDNVLVPIGSGVGRRGWEVGAIIVGLSGLALWLKMQAKYNKEAAENPDQLK